MERYNIYIYIYETTRVYIYTCFFGGAGFGKLFGASDKNKTNKETRRNETCRSKNTPRSIWGLYFESSKYIRIDVGVFSFNVKIWDVIHLFFVWNMRTSCLYSWPKGSIKMAVSTFFFPSGNSHSRVQRLYIVPYFQSWVANLGSAGVAGINHGYCAETVVWWPKG